MKYICFQLASGVEEVILFPRTIHHDCFAQQQGGIKNQSYGNWERVSRFPISAGFVDHSLKCYGNSETLNLTSRPEDTLILKRQLSDRWAVAIDVD